jgi:hypothetical protein
MVNLVGFFGVPTIKMFPMGFIEVCILGDKKLFLGVLTNIKIFFSKKDLNYFNMIHRNKSLKKLFFMGA